MEQQVREMEPILAKKAEESIALVQKLKVEQAAADKVKITVIKDEAEAKVFITNGHNKNLVLELLFENLTMNCHGCASNSRYVA